MREVGAVVALGLLGMLAGCGEGGSALQPGIAGQTASAGQATTAGTGSNPQPTAGSAGAPPVGSAGTGTDSAGQAGNNSAGGANGGNGGNSSSGGSPGGSGGRAGGSGSGGGGSAGGPGLPQVMTNKVFSQCRMHFGTIDYLAKNKPELIAELDFFTPGWMGQSDTFDMKAVCDEGKEGAVLGKLVPVVVAYVSAFYIKRHHGGLCDCNVNGCGMVDGKVNDLCHFGSQYIKQDLSAIVNVYKSYAQGYANCYGTTRPIIFEMEPDWYQYTGSTQTQPMTKQEAATIIHQYVDAIKSALPNAVFSIDISPWIDDNGKTNGKDWYSHFDLSKFTYANTSGGSTQAATAKLRNDNLMTWSGVTQATGKGVLADTGYGANGVSAGHDANWDNADNLNARIADGVVSISQYNPKGDWASAIKSVRSQLKTPPYCP